MPGIRISDTITSVGVFASSSRAATPLKANSILHSFLISRRDRRIACITSISSSTNRMRIMTRPTDGYCSRGQLPGVDGFYRCIDGQPNKERCALTAFRLEAQCTAMLFYDDATCNCESLPGAYSHFFGREERVEYLVARRFWNSGAGIGNRDFHFITVEPGADRELAENTGIPHDIRYRMRCIHQQVENDLVYLTQIARHGWQLAELCVEFGDVFVLIVRDDESAADRLIQIGKLLFRLIRVRKFLHRTHDCRYTP